MSKKRGMSAEAYQEWDAIMQHSGASIESMGPAMKTLSTQAQKGSAAFQQLGISEEQVAKMSKEDLFSAVITGLQNMEEGTERTYLASQLLGKGATELGPLLNTSAADTQAMRDRVHELGGVMSNEAVKSAAAYQDSLQDMTTALDGMKRNMLSEFMPSITMVMDGLTELFSGGDGIEQIRAGIASFTDKMSEILPRVVEIGTDIVIALAEAIIDSLPALVERAPEIIAKLVSALVRSAPKLLVAAVQLVGALVSGLIQSIPAIVGAGGELVSGLARAIGDAVRGAFNWGKDLVDNFIGGIRSMWEKARGAVANFAGMIRSFLGFSEPEIGPLSNFHTYAPDMMKLFAQGIKDNENLVSEQIGKSFDFGQKMAPAAQNAGGVEFSIPRSNSNAGSPTPIVLQLDDYVLGRALLPVIEAERQRVGVKLARGGAY